MSEPAASTSGPGWTLRAWAGVGLVVALAFALAWGLQLRRDTRERELIESVRALSRDGGLQMLTRADCRDCSATLEWLRKVEIRVETCDLGQQPACGAAHPPQELKRLPVFVVHGRQLVRSTELSDLREALEAAASKPQP